MPLAALTPVAAGGETVAFPIDWEAVTWLWSLDGYPSDPAFADFHRKSLRGARPWTIGGDAYDAAAGDAAPRELGREFVAASRLGSRGFARSAGARAWSSSRSTPSCWGTGGGRGRRGSRKWRRRRASRASSWSPSARHASATSRRSGRCVARHGVRARTCVPGTPRGRRHGLGGAAAGAPRAARSAGGLRGAAAERATRELLALQASDWAFLDRRRQAGDYPWQRTTDHAEALLESINSGDDPRSRRLRNLAPDLSLEPLLEP